MDERKAERVRESVRTGLAKALGATAQGLATVSRAAASTAAQLRPPEPAQGSDRPPPSPPRTPSATTGAASTEPGSASADGAPTEREPSSAASEAPSSDGGRDVSALVERNARDVIAEVSDLGPADLRRLRAAEQRSKARKTVLAAIDRALEG